MGKRDRQATQDEDLQISIVNPIDEAARQQHLQYRKRSEKGSSRVKRHCKMAEDFSDVASPVVELVRQQAASTVPAEDIISAQETASQPPHVIGLYALRYVIKIFKIECAQINPMHEWSHLDDPIRENIAYFIEFLWKIPGKVLVPNLISFLLATVMHEADDECSFDSNADDVFFKYAKSINTLLIALIKHCSQNEKIDLWLWLALSQLVQPRITPEIIALLLEKGASLGPVSLNNRSNLREYMYAQVMPYYDINNWLDYFCRSEKTCNFTPLNYLVQYCYANNRKILEENNLFPKILAVIKIMLTFYLQKSEQIPYIYRLLLNTPSDVNQIILNALVEVIKENPVEIIHANAQAILKLSTQVSQQVRQQAATEAKIMELDALLNQVAERLGWYEFKMQRFIADPYAAIKSQLMQLLAQKKGMIADDRSWAGMVAAHHSFSGALHVSFLYYGCPQISENKCFKLSLERVNDVEQWLLRQNFAADLIPIVLQAVLFIKEQCAACTVSGSKRFSVKKSIVINFNFIASNSIEYHSGLGAQILVAQFENNAVNFQAELVAKKQAPDLASDSDSSSYDSDDPALGLAELNGIQEIAISDDESSDDEVAAEAEGVQPLTQDNLMRLMTGMRL